MHHSDIVVTPILVEQIVVVWFTKSFMAKVFEGHLNSLGLRSFCTGQVGDYLGVCPGLLHAYVSYTHMFYSLTVKFNVVLSH